MKQTVRKALSLLLTLALLCGMLIIPAGAAGTSPFSLKESTITVAPGDTFTLTINASDASQIEDGFIAIYYDTSVFTLEQVASDLDLDFYSESSTATYYEFGIYPNGGITETSCEFVTATFTVSPEAAEGDYTFTVSGDCCVDGDYLTFDAMTATVTVSAGSSEPELPQLPAPTITSSEGDVIEWYGAIFIRSTESGVTIYYTLDGTDPLTNGQIGTAISVDEGIADAVSPDGTVTVKAVAVKEGYRNSEVAEVTFATSFMTPPTSFSPVSGTELNAGDTVTISCAESGATIYYTTDGSTPTKTSTVYSGPVVVTGDVTIKTIALKNNYMNSAVAEASYTVAQSTSYAITVAGTTNGSVTAPATAAEGDTVTLTVVPADGYELDTLTVVDSTGAAVTVTDNSFTMPASDVTVSATFKAVAGPVVYTISTTTTTKDGTGTYRPEIYINGAMASSDALQNVEEGASVQVAYRAVGRSENLEYNSVVVQYTKDGAAQTIDLLAQYGQSESFYFTMPAANVNVVAEIQQLIEVITAATENGSVTYSTEDGAVTPGIIGTWIRPGKTVAVTATPADGYELDTITVTDANSAAVTVTGNSFTMPASAVTVNVTFKEAGVDKPTFTVTNATYEGTTLTMEVAITGIEVTAQQASSDLVSVHFKCSIAGVTLGTPTVTEGDNVSSAWYNSAQVGAYLGKMTASDTAMITLTYTAVTLADGSYTVSLTEPSGWSWIWDEAAWVPLYTGDAVTAVPYTLTVESAPAPAQYNVTVNTPANGTVSVDKTTAAEGDTVTLTVVPADGYELDTLTVVDSTGAAVTVTDNSFTMPASDVTVSAAFKQITYTLSYTTSVNQGTGTYTPEFYIDGVYAGRVQTIQVAAGQNVQVKYSAVERSLDLEFTRMTVDYTLDGAAQSLDLLKSNYIFTMPAADVVITTVIQKLYLVTAASAENGSFTIANSSGSTVSTGAYVKPGETLTVTAAPAEGYVLDTLSVTDSTGAAVAVTGNSFTMPVSDITVRAAFAELGPSTTYVWYLYDEDGSDFTISTADELKEFANIVNGTAVDSNGTAIAQDDFSGKTVTLANDIALAEDGLYTANAGVTYGMASYPLTTTQYVVDADAPIWTPIGSGTAGGTYGNTVTTTYAFAGTFDGAGYTISGVYTGDGTATTANTVAVQGLFGIVTGTVKNVTVSGCITGKSVVGGVTAYLNGGTIENCVNNAIVFSDGGNIIGAETGTSGAGATGGIAGLAAGTGFVTGCTNNGRIICANSNKGGRVAGIVGLIDQPADVISISRCANHGDIEGYQYVAGIVGLQYAANSTVDSCYNTGEIHASGAQKVHAGGIVGQLNGLVSNCYNTGGVHTYWTAKTQYFGGLVGDYDYTTATGKIVNSYNIGAVTYVTTDIVNGGAVATANECPQENCYYLDTVIGESNSAIVGTGSTVKTADEMKTDEFVLLLGEAFNCDSDAINGGYPVLDWQGGREPVKKAPSIITTAEDLQLLANEVNAGENKAGQTYTLGADIDLTGIDWAPIGGAVTNVPLTIGSQEELDAALEQYILIYDTAGNSYKKGASEDKQLPWSESTSYYYVTGPIFSGTFDGAGKTISGLSVNVATGYAGLFGNVDGTIQNLTVSGSVTSTSTTLDFVGGVAGKLSMGGTIERVTSYVTVTAGCYNVGGIVGCVGSKGSFESANNTFVIECVNYGNVTGYQAVGGIAGHNAGQIQRCANFGDINATKTGSKSGVGGIVGRNGENNTACDQGTVIDCYNTGTIGNSAAKWVGGIVGFNPAYSSVINCYNTGTCLGAGQTNPIAGQNEASAVNGAIISNCWYLDTTKVFDESGVYGGNQANCGPKTEAEMKEAIFAAILGSSYNCDLTGEDAINNGYPVLAWQGGTAAPAIYTVTIPASGDGYTVTIADGSSTVVAEGGSFSFYVYLLSDYEIESVMAGETVLTAESGMYTVSNITADVTVTITVKSTAAPGVVYGDVNGDGAVNLADYMAIRQYINGTADLDADQLIAADVNGDSVINLADYMLIRQYINGSVSVFPVEEE